jgi:hypothetical protein
LNLAQDAMHIKGRRAHIGLTEHYVHLAPMMRLMIEEWRTACGAEFSQSLPRLFL